MARVSIISLIVVFFIFSCISPATSHAADNWWENHDGGGNIPDVPRPSPSGSGDGNYRRDGTSNVVAQIIGAPIVAPIGVSIGALTGPFVGLEWLCSYLTGSFPNVNGFLSYNTYLTRRCRDDNNLVMSFSTNVGMHISALPWLAVYSVGWGVKGIGQVVAWSVVKTGHGIVKAGQGVGNLVKAAFSRRPDWRERRDAAKKRKQQARAKKQKERERRVHAQELMKRFHKATTDVHLTALSDTRMNKVMYEQNALFTDILTHDAISPEEKRKHSLNLPNFITSKTSLKINPPPPLPLGAFIQDPSDGYNDRDAESYVPGHDKVSRLIAEVTDTLQSEAISETKDFLISFVKNPRAAIALKGAKFYSGFVLDDVLPNTLKVIGNTADLIDAQNKKIKNFMQ